MKPAKSSTRGNAFNLGLAVTPSDTVNLLAGCSAIYCGGAGIVRAVFQDDSTADFTVVAGGLLPLLAKRVNSTGTTATLLVALYQV